MSRFKTLSSSLPVRGVPVHDAPVRDAPVCDESRPLAIHVAFTSEQETIAALRHAAKLAAGLDARLLILAPQVVPYGVDLDQPPVPPEFTAGRMVRLAEQAGVEADVHVVLCRDRIEGLERVLGTHAVVIGGENKLARQLTKRGHEVLVVDRSVVDHFKDLEEKS